MVAKLPKRCCLMSQLTTRTHEDNSVLVSGLEKIRTMAGWRYSSGSHDAAKLMFTLVMLYFVEMARLQLNSRRRSILIHEKGSSSMHPLDPAHWALSLSFLAWDSHAENTCFAVFPNPIEP